MAVLQGEFCAVNIIFIASIPCQAKWPVYRGGCTSESRNSRDSTVALCMTFNTLSEYFRDIFSIIGHFMGKKSNNVVHA